MYVDIDRIESAEGLVTVFSQRRRDGVITFAFHRKFEIMREGRAESITTAFAPENMMDAYIQHVLLSRDRLIELQQKRAQGELKFPEGGERRRRS